MPLSLSPDEKIARLRQDLRMGAFLLIRAEDGLWLAASSETVLPQRFEFMMQQGDIELVITDRRAVTLKTWGSDGDLARLRVPKGRGINWVRSMADPSDDLSNPLKGPFDVVMGGSASIHRAVLGLCKQSYLLPSAVLVRYSGADVGDLAEVALSEIEAALARLSPLDYVAAANVPLAVSKAGKVHVFRPADGGEEHYAIEIGTPSRDAPVLSRLHSACFTGDLIGSLKCDCGAQLQAALAAIGKEGSGVLLYLNQEGRGIGLANKMRAYSLQDEGFDTVEANHRLGFEDDERDFRLGAEILSSMGFSAVRLMTNNPAKTEMMEKCGITVAERVPLQVGRNPVNDAYLDTKAKKSGHLL